MVKILLFFLILFSLQPSCNANIYISSTDNENYYLDEYSVKFASEGVFYYPGPTNIIGATIIVTYNNYVPPVIANVADMFKVDNKTAYSKINILYNTKTNTISPLDRTDYNRDGDITGYQDYASVKTGQEDTVTQTKTTKTTVANTVYDSSEARSYTEPHQIYKNLKRYDIENYYHLSCWANSIDDYANGQFDLLLERSLSEGDSISIASIVR